MPNRPLEQLADRRSFLQSAAAVGLGLPAGGAAAAAPADPIKLDDIRPLPGWATVWDEKPVAVGLRKQLLVDDYAVSQGSNVRRELVPMTKANGGKPLLVADRPWEDVLLGACVTAVHDGKQFQLWYNANSGLLIAYATSPDGLTWTKPNLGLYDFDPKKQKDELGFAPVKVDPGFKGGKANNLVGHFGNGFTCFLDAHETDPAHRYKAAYGPDPNKNRAVCLAHSPDGLRWTPYHGGKPVLGPPNDSICQILWDEGAKLYRFYGRHDYGTPGGAKEVRGSRHLTNPDVKANPANWKLTRTWLFDREGPHEYLRRQVMCLSDTIHEGVHFGLVSVYEWPTGGDAGPSGVHQKGLDHRRRHERDVCDVYLATCRDGDSWDLSWVYAGKPLLWRGPDGAYDKDYLCAATSFVTRDDQHWLYYGGFDERNFGVPSRSGIGLATAPLDRFVCLEPWVKEEPGWVVTKPFRVEGSRLEVNLDARHGEFLVEVLAADTGEPVAGYARGDVEVLQGVDGLRLRPHWRGRADLDGVKGRLVRLKFHLKNARLYAFQVTDG